MSTYKSAQIVAQPEIARRQIIVKVRDIYIPFLLISVAFIITYSFLNWLLVIKTHAISINEGYVNYIIPLLLPWVPILFWLRPRLGALEFKNSDNRFLYELIAALGAAVPTIIAQSYLTTATGKLTRVEAVSQIPDSAPTKYYSIDEFEVDKRDVSAEVDTHTSGRYNQYLNFDLFLVAPLRDPILLRLNSPKFINPRLEPCQVWFGAIYNREIRNRLPEVDKREGYERFLNASLSEFKQLNPRDFSYFERVGNNGFQEWFEAAIKKNKHHPIETKPVILLGRSGSFEERSRSAFNWTFGSFGIAATVWFLMLLFPKLDEARLRDGKSKRIAKRQSADDWWRLFIPSREFLITPIIIDANIFIFLLMVSCGLGFWEFRGGDLLAWGANYWPLIRQGQWFRVVTSMFLHGGAMHLFMNTYGLLFTGILLELRLSPIKFTLAYFVAGIAASITSGLFHPNAVSVGASGGIFGLYGVFLVLLVPNLSNRRGKTLKFPAVNFFIFIIGSLVISGLTVGVDNAAHVGGFLTGILLGVALYVTRRRARKAECRS